MKNFKKVLDHDEMAELNYRISKRYIKERGLWYLHKEWHAKEGNQLTKPYMLDRLSLTNEYHYLGVFLMTSGAIHMNDLYSYEGHDIIKSIIADRIFAGRTKKRATVD